MLDPVVKGSERNARELDLAPRSNPGVERRGRTAAGELSPEQSREVAAAARVVLGGMRGPALCRSSAALDPHLEEDGLGEPHRRRAVSERVVDAPDECTTALAQGHKVYPPEGPRAIELLREELGHGFAQAGLIHLDCLVRGHDVRGWIKVAILAPNRGVGGAVKSTPKLRSGPKPRGDLV